MGEDRGPGAATLAVRPLPLAASSPGRRVYRSFLALRYIKSRPVNLISIGGVMLGVAVLIVVTAVMDGFQERVRAVVRGNLSHLSIVPMQGELPEVSALAARLKADEPRIVGIAPMATAPMGYFYTDTHLGALRLFDQPLLVMSGVGLDWELEKRIEAELVRRQDARALDGGLRIVAGDPADPFGSARATSRERTPVLVSRAFAETFRGARTPEALARLVDPDLDALEAPADLFVEVLQQTQDGSGRPSVAHHGRNFVISAVYDGGDQAEDRGRLIFRRLDLVEAAKLQSPWHELRLWLDDYEEAEAVKLSMAARHPNLRVETWEDQRADFLRAVKTEKVLLVIVLSFIVLLGGFIILATLTLIVVEKTRDIGVLAALGASRGGILSIFLRNGFLIGVIGAVLGLGLGALLTTNLDNIKEFFEGYDIYLFPKDIYLFTEIPTVWSWPTVAVIMGGSVLVAFLAGLLPALRASRLDPIVALRHE